MDTALLNIDPPRKTLGSALLGAPAVALGFASTATAVVKAVKQLGGDPSEFSTLEDGGWAMVGALLAIAVLGIRWPRASLVATALASSAAIICVCTTERGTGVAASIINAIDTSAIAAAGTILALSIFTLAALMN